ncbi:MAG: Gfo/Idh/MocA family oxidoreductase [Saccharofermentanales bacterium]
MKGVLDFMLKVCLIGCGRVAKSHVASVKEIPKYIKIVAVVDTNIANAQAFQKEYGVDCAYSSFEEALAKTDFDAVDICLPNFLHKEMVIKCAAAKKHILVEKPMANTVEECSEMIEAAEKAKVILMIGQSRRFYNAVIESRNMKQQGAIGELVSISANLYGYLANAPTPWWNEAKKAGGLMIPIWGSHIIDYCLWMFEELPQRVYCESYSINPQWEGEDEVTILIGFSRNRFATIRMSWNTKLKETAWNGEGKMLSSADILYERYIQGTKGTLYLNDETVLTHNGSPVKLDKQELSNFALQYMEFANAIKEKRQPIANGKEIINVILIQQAALKSAETHQVVMIKPLNKLNSDV